MMRTQNLLVELFVEELPPKALKKLSEAFAAALSDSLKTQGLATDQSATTPFATPRRLAAHISAVRSQATDKAVSQKLMPVSVGLSADGHATPALLSWSQLYKYSGVQINNALDLNGKRVAVLAVPR